MILIYSESAGMCVAERHFFLALTRDLCCLETPCVVRAKLEQLVHHLWLQHLLHQVTTTLFPHQPRVSPVGWGCPDVGVNRRRNGEVCCASSRVLQDVVQLLLCDELPINVYAKRGVLEHRATEGNGNMVPLSLCQQVWAPSTAPKVPYDIRLPLSDSCSKNSASA